MAINYTKINEGRGWDNNSYINPSNMNHMDDGIKAACDAIDSEVVKLTKDALQTIANTATGANAAVSLKSNNVRSVADYRDQNGTALGMMGFDSNKKPTIYDVPSNTWKEIALAENVVKLTSSTIQVINGAGLRIAGDGALVNLLQINNTNTNIDGTNMVFQQAGTAIGYLSVFASDHKLYYNNTTNWKEIALVENTAPQAVVGNVVPNTTTTYEIPASISQNGSVYLIAVRNEYGGGLVALLFRVTASSATRTRIVVLSNPSSNMSIQSIAGESNKFTIVAADVDGTIVMTKLA